MQQQTKKQYTGIWRPQIFLVVASVYGFANAIPVFLFDLGFSPLLMVALRTGLGAITLLIIFRSALFHMSKTDWKYGLVCGILNTFNLLLLTYAIKIAGPATTIIMYNSGVVMIPFANWLIRKQKPRPVNVIAALLCATGLIFALLHFDVGLTFGLGEGLALLAAVIYAVFYIVLDKGAKKTNASNLNFIQHGLSFMICLPAFFIFEFSSMTFVPEMWNFVWVIIFLGVVNDGLAYLLQTKGQSKIDPNTSSIYLYTACLFNVLFSIILGFDAFRWQLVVGATIVVASTILPNIVDWVKAAKAKKHRQLNEGVLASDADMEIEPSEENKTNTE